MESPRRQNPPSSSFNESLTNLDNELKENLVNEPLTNLDNILKELKDVEIPEFASVIRSIVSVSKAINHEQPYKYAGYDALVTNYYGYIGENNWKTTYQYYLDEKKKRQINTLK